MKKQHSELFKILINAYYNDKLENVIEELLKDNTVDKEALAAEISSLCGVNLSFSNNYIEDLKKAINNYESDHKIVNKIKLCKMECKVDCDGKTKCQESCPFDAILYDEKTKCTYIDNDKCTDCGFCVEGCPTGSILDTVEFMPLAKLLRENTPVVAAVAPAIMGQFGDSTIEQLRTAFKSLGFTDMVEVAFFADMLTLKETIEFDAHVKTKSDFMITSCCCPMWVGMIKKVYKDLLPHTSPTVSPMIAAGRVLKKLNPDVKVVFIGPCVAKKAEVKSPDLIGDIDFVLTFAELQEIFEAFNVVPETLEGTTSMEYASRGGRLYARTGGVSIAIEDCIERMFPEKYKLVTPIQGNGIKECKEILQDLQKGIIKGNFIEGMGCVGGCVGGPKAIVPKDNSKIAVDTFADNSKYKVAYDSPVMNGILDAIGIFTIEDYKDENKTEIFHRDF
ncbi:MULTISPECIES: [Fe-Fe] hydrogenase large subunit C-terminal domain-containing protein [unclassified Clostridium]|uniref:[Fe-Fe] hydrogenase large subunit C-terminal domain-containing protein n=1 Tax=unclassified Clostridium TaxID=2614128 RepID=UPI003217907C